jgi:stearoyl-CoA desaturase (delta-9 desaturase)
MAHVADAGSAAPTARRIDLVKSIPFFAVHAVALAAVAFGPFSWKLVALAAGSYALRIFGITGGYHRYLSHRSYQTSRPFQFLLALLGTTATQKGPLWWAAHHRDHHRFSDGPQDIHSPVQSGFWWSHVGWILSTEYDATKLDRVKDLARYPELRWLDRWHLVPVVGYATLFWFVAGWPGVLWGYFVSQVFVWHGTFLVNSLAHVMGRRRYETTDDSRNSALIAILTLGEGWHNNHHHYQSTANQGWFWWEVDVTYYVLRGLSAVGLVHGLRLPPAAVRDGWKRPAAAARPAPADRPAPAVAAPGAGG